MDSNFNHTKQYKAFIWDIDNILLQTTRRYQESQIIALRMVGISEDRILSCVDLWNHLLWYFDQDDFIGIINAILYETQHSILDKHLVISASQKADEIWETALDKPNKLDNLLRKLLYRHLKLGIVSNGDAKFQMDKLLRSNLKTHFETKNIVVYESSSFKAKPNPDGLLKCCDNLEIEPRFSLYIGDRVTDIIAANLAGLDSCHVNIVAPEFKHPQNMNLKIEKATYYFKTMDDLITSLDLAIDSYH